MEYVDLQCYVSFRYTTKWLVIHMCACMLSCFSHVRLWATLWTITHQGPPSIGFSRQEYWSVLPYPPPGDLPDLGIELTSLQSHAVAGRFFTTSATWEAHMHMHYIHMYICIYTFFFTFFSHVSYYIILREFPVLYSRSFLLYLLYTAVSIC